MRAAGTWPCVFGDLDGRDVDWFDHHHYPRNGRPHPSQFTFAAGILRSLSRFALDLWEVQIWLVSLGAYGHGCRTRGGILDVAAQFWHGVRRVCRGRRLVSTG